jgi:predicted deacylase
MERFTIPSQMNVPPSRGARGPERRVAFAGRTLTPGRHTVILDGAGGETVATVLVGAAAGPRLVVLGGGEPDDSLGLAVARRVLERLEGKPLAGSVVLVPQVARYGRRAPLVEGAQLVVELRAGEPGWSTAPHLRANLGDPRAARLARGFGAAILVDGLRGPAHLRYEAGERGRWDAAAAEGGAAGVLSLLGARGVADVPRVAPSLRMIVDDVVRLRLRRGGTVVPAARAGALVRRGEALVAVYADGGRERAVISASRRSVVLATIGVPAAAPGAAVARVGRVRSATRAPAPPIVAGWCERVALPDLGIRRLSAKLDTGARTSALHVLAMHETPAGLAITLPIAGAPQVTVAVVEHVVVKDSGGHAERRPVIETGFVMGPIARRIRLTLTHRGDMRFPMLVGRSAMGPGVLVDAGRQGLLGS